MDCLPLPPLPLFTKPTIKHKMKVKQLGAIMSLVSFVWLVMWLDALPDSMTVQGYTTLPQTGGQTNYGTTGMAH